MNGIEGKVSSTPGDSAVAQQQKQFRALEEQLILANNILSEALARIEDSLNSLGIEHVPEKVPEEPSNKIATEIQESLYNSLNSEATRAHRLAEKYTLIATRLERAY